MPDDALTHYDYCMYCHRLTRSVSVKGTYHCGRCGKASPPPTDRRDAIEAVKRVHARSDLGDGDHPGGAANDNVNHKKAKG